MVLRFLESPYFWCRERLVDMHSKAGESSAQINSMSKIAEIALLNVALFFSTIPYAISLCINRCQPSIEEGLFTDSEDEVKRADSDGEETPQALPPSKGKVWSILDYFPCFVISEEPIQVNI